MDRRSFLQASGLALLASSSSGFLAKPAFAQDFPKGPIRLVVGYAAGGATDILARMLAEAIKPALGADVIVENKAGAAGIIGATFVAKSAPDGQTLLFGSNSGLAATAPTMTPVPFDSIKDFTPIAKAGSYDPILVVHPDFPAKDLDAFIKLMKAEPAKHKYAVSGVGNLIHLAAELFFAEAGLKLTTVPYSGGAPAIADTTEGRVPIFMTGLGTVGPQIEAGKLRLIASSGDKRLPQYPQIPTFKDAGYPKAVASVWNAVFAPGNTPRPVVDKLNKAIVAAFADPAFRKKWEAIGGDPVSSSPDELRAEMEPEIRKWRPVMEKAGLIGK